MFRSNVNSLTISHPRYLAIHAAACDAQSSPSFKTSQLIPLKCQILTTRIKTYHSRRYSSIFCYSWGIIIHRALSIIPDTKPCDQICKPKIKSTNCILPIAETQPKYEVDLLLAAWVVSHFSWLLLLKAFTLILKWYAIHKAIHFIPEYIILMIIKSFCMHILPIHLKKAQILTNRIDKFIRQEIINYFGRKKSLKKILKKNLAQHSACRFLHILYMWWVCMCACVYIYI